jgi:predicted ATPase
VQHIHQAVTLAQDVAHPFTLVYAWTSAAVIYHCRREASQAHGWAARAIALARDQGFPLRLAQAMILQGWAQTAQGQSEEYIAHMQQGLTMFRETGAVLNLPYWLLPLAEAQEMAGHIGEGLQAASQALDLADHTGERYYEAELYRLQGALLLHQSPDASPAAESCFHQALAIARHQHAKALELRAATSLARLWQQQDKRQEAHDLLAPIYGWFTEGFDTADLQEAKALLEALS